MTSGTPGKGQLRCYAAHCGAVWGMIAGSKQYVEVRRLQPLAQVCAYTSSADIRLWYRRSFADIYLRHGAAGRSPINILLKGLAEFNAIGISFYRIYSRRKRS